MAIFLPDLRTPDGRVWQWWKGSLYRCAHSAVPAAMLREDGAEDLETGEWI